MKKLFFAAVVSLFAISVQAQPPQIDAKSGMTFGQKFESAAAVDINKAAANFTDESSAVVVSGKVTSVCKAEGCWLKLAGDDGDIMVKMKDHAFLVPVSLEGKEVAIKGTGLVKEISVETLKHYAEDAGKSKEEISKIKEPQRQVVFYAEGLEVK
jgi:hypothetical protein